MNNNELFSAIETKINEIKDKNLIYIKNKKDRLDLEILILTTEQNFNFGINEAENNLINSIEFSELKNDTARKSFLKNKLQSLIETKDNELLKLKEKQNALIIEQRELLGELDYLRSLKNLYELQLKN